ncbi:MAG: LPXTG cell wall anchor domain-containing protein [Flavobacterium sp.]|nr:LPXTG cell wall anchor domain-containing protein [Pedobacter sp.]
MKQLFFFILLLVTIPAFAQWQSVKIDSAVSFQLPKGFERTKTNSENNFVARTSFGTILVFKETDNPVVFPDIAKDKHLKKFYDHYVNRVRSSTADGKITQEKDTLLGDLKVKDFTLEVDSGGGLQLRKFRILHANNATYTFEFLSQELHKDYSAQESNQFFNSIKVKENIDRADQFNTSDEKKSGTNYTWFIVAGIILLIGLIIYFFYKKNNPKLPS